MNGKQNLIDKFDKAAKQLSESIEELMLALEKGVNEEEAKTIANSVAPQAMLYSLSLMRIAKDQNFRSMQKEMCFELLDEILDYSKELRNSCLGEMNGEMYKETINLKFIVPEDVIDMLSSAKKKASISTGR